MANRAVSFVYTHQVVHIPGHQFSNTLNKGDLSTNEKARGGPPCTMFQTDLGVEVQYKGKHFLIPWGNISNVVFESVPVKSVEKQA